ncbi:MAG: hypothetical protein Tsb005_13070 [Gammaproteobacteria bacterium]
MTTEIHTKPPYSTTTNTSATDTLSNTQREIVEVQILGMRYSVKCAPEEINLLQAAAQCLDNKMTEIRASGFPASREKVAVIAALNLCHEFLTQAQQHTHYIEHLTQVITGLHQKIVTGLSTTDEITDDTHRDLQPALEPESV